MVWLIVPGVVVLIVAMMQLVFSLSDVLSPSLGGYSYGVAELLVGLFGIAMGLLMLRNMLKGGEK